MATAGSVLAWWHLPRCGSRLSRCPGVVACSRHASSAQSWRRWAQWQGAHCVAAEVEGAMEDLSLVEAEAAGAADADGDRDDNTDGGGGGSAGCVVDSLGGGNRRGGSDGDGFHCIGNVPVEAADMQAAKAVLKSTLRSWCKSNGHEVKAISAPAVPLQVQGGVATW